MMPVPTQFDAAIVVFGMLFSAIALLRIPREDLDRLPLSGLILLLLFYILLGWALGSAQVSISIWFGALIAGFAVAIAPSVQLGRAGLTAFILGGIAAIVMVLNRDPIAQTARLSAVGLGLMGLWFWAVGGARYRMERMGFRRSMLWWTLILTAWEGLWIGWLVHTFVVPQMGTWLTQLGADLKNGQTICLPIEMPGSGEFSDRCELESHRDKLQSA